MKEQIEQFLEERKIAMAKLEGRMEVINKEIEELKIQMKETDKELRKLI